MAIKNMKNKKIIGVSVIFLLLLIIFLIIIINHSIIAYKYVYKDKNIISSLLVNESFSQKTIAYDDNSDGAWFHHMNNIKVAQNLQNKSTSYEIDITFWYNNLYVAHDEDELKDKITLEYYLSSFEDLKGRKFWFDIKNLNATNYDIVLTLINKLLLESNIGSSLVKSDIIIESSNLEALKLIYNFIKDDEERYILSWYFPYMDLSDTNKLINIINDYVQSVKDDYFFDYVSGDVQYYKLMSRIFPNRKKLYWYVGGCNPERKYKRMLLFKYIKKDPTTEITLGPACL